ncbi:hypothetical protein JTE88_00535 [Arcanobacterium phocisimile]|uniref:PH domain-containing protein n=1 Tax=Arcanobacterium phocisimile TaxID=1302235 RepID=A0ABX7IGN5_9ACTO|nr:hypothetical protein [Arcanobacterium phocisimile]QRV02284.1 hypothetical protein JTE88_00535 [Arcanobacterium phocisimile]
MSGTDIILRMNRVALPASRPIDHARRMSAAVLMGFLFGSVVGMFLFIDEVPLGRMAFTLLPVALLAAIVFGCWYVWQPESAPQRAVVARVIGTNETEYAREVRSGGGRGILVPVVALPVDGGAPFSSMVTMRTRVGEVADPPVGTLLPLFQTDPELGELVEGTATAQQLELMDKLRHRPRILPNKAEILPVRRSPLERTPTWAAVQWWASAGIAAFAAMLFVGSLRG